MIVTVFKNIFDISEPYYTEAFELFKRIKDGNSKETIESIRNAKDKDEKAKLKKRLPSICWSGKFSKRAAGALIEHSGYMCLDIDDLSTDDLPKIKKLIVKDENTFACFVSPGGLGFKVIIKITPGKAYHKEQFLALEVYFNEKINKFTSTKKNEKKLGAKTVKIDKSQGDYLRVHIDESGKDIGRVCYESYDPKIYWNDDSEIWVECIEEEVISLTIEDQNERIALLQKWIDGQESYHDGNRNNYLSKFLYAMCRYGVDDYKARDYLMKKFPGLPSKDLDAMTKSCYSKGDFNTETFTEQQRKKNRVVEVNIQEAKEVTAFWSINDKGRVHIDTKQFLRFVSANGFKIYRQNRGDRKFQFVHVQNMVVDIVDVLDIKKYILKHVEKHASAPVFDELQMRNRYFENTFLNALPLIKVEQIKDSKDSSFIFFEKFYYRITAEGSTKHDYIDLEGKHIWKSQICCETITKVVKYKDHDFSKFILNAMKGDKNRATAACAALGYGIHTFKKKSLAKLVYACDQGIGELDGLAMGGTGKNLFFECLKYVRSVVEVDGKDLDKRDKFKFQMVSDDTQIVNIDDYEGDIKELFTKVTGHFEVEKKGMDKTAMGFESSPKIFATSNHAPKGFSDSFTRRLQLIEFSDHYSAAHTPSDEFGDRDFFSGDWNQDDWNALYSFIFDCVRLYLKDGLKDMELDTELFKYKQLVKNTGRDFAEYFKDFDINGFELAREVYSDYKAETRDDVRPQEFYGKIRKMCIMYGWEYEKEGRGYDHKIRIIKNDKEF